MWVPLVDGTERLGVLSLLVSDAGEAMLAVYRALASLAALIIVAKGGYSDTYAYTRRSAKMALQAELIWALLPPQTFATDRVLVTAALEPAYQAGGDAFDYALLGDHLHVSIFDALGHDLAAGLLASVGMASCRSTRRAGGTLPDIVARADARGRRAIRRRPVRHGAAVRTGPGDRAAELDSLRPSAAAADPR